MESSKARARGLWDAGRALEAGHILLHAAAPAELVHWAAAVLETCCEHLQTQPRELSELLELVQDESRWRRGHAAFEAIRRLTLRVESGECSMPDATTGMLYLGENVAKLTYNATVPANPFDADAGAWVVANAHWIAQRVTNDAFRERLWEALCAISHDG
jgi:hypothetical protein